MNDIFTWIENYFRMSMRRKLIIAEILVIGLTCILASIYYVHQQTRILRESEIAKGRIITVLLAANFKTMSYFNSKEILPGVAKKYFNHEDVNAVSFYNTEGAVIATKKGYPITHKNKDEHNDNINHLIQASNYREDIYFKEYENSYIYWVPVKQEAEEKNTFSVFYNDNKASKKNRLVGFFRVQIDKGYFYRQIQIYEMRGIVVTIVILFLAYVATAVVTGKITNHLEVLTDNIKYFGVGKSNNKLETKTIDELSTIVSAYNRIYGVLINSEREKRQIEERLIDTMKMEAVSILAGGIAHDFNNLLTTILNKIYIAKAMLYEDDMSYNKIMEIVPVAEHGRELSRQLIMLSRGDTMRREVVEMKKLLEGTIRLMLSGSNIRCNCKQIEEGIYCELNETQLKQTIGNILLNAKDAMPDGGVIDITCESYIETRGKGMNDIMKYVRITIKDYGPGIEADKIDKIFTPFYTTKEKGHGLGLSTAYFIVKRHGGNILVNSAINIGTTFTIFLPQVLVSETTVKRGDKYKDRRILLDRPEKIKIILMDDNEDIRKDVSEIMRSYGYFVISAANGEEAIQHYEEMMNNGSKVDMVIMDLTVPGGKGGRETISELLIIDPKVKAIAASGYTEDELMCEPQKHGFRAAIAKPYTIEQLEQVIAENVFN